MTLNSPLQLTVLGSSSAIPRPGRACSSYMLAAGDRTILLDFGTGAFANLIRYKAAHEIDAIVISHLHGDHFLDVIPMRYALKYGNVRRSTPLPLYLPPGGRAVLERIGESISGENTAFYDNVFDLREYAPDRPLSLAGFDLTLMPVRHYIDAYAKRLSINGMNVVYSADTAFDDHVIEIAREADLFICEATLGANGVEAGDRGHSSAQEAGLMAQRAGVARLALTHYGAEHDPAALCAAAQAVFSGPVVVLDDHMQLTIEAPARFLHS